MPCLTPVSLDQALDRAHLDLLQIDDWLGDLGDFNQSPEPVQTRDQFTGYFRQLHKAMFLRPGMRMVSECGGGDVVRSVESLAELLVEHGSPELPVAAIRGDNVLPDLDAVLGDDWDFAGRTVLAAHAELGAGPVATALADGARWIVAGSYDVSAPFIAVAASGGVYAWQNLSRLAEIAAASHFHGALVELRPECVELDHADPRQCAHIRELGSIRHADVRCSYEALQLEPTSRGTLRIAGVTAETASPFWNVRIRVGLESSATALVEVRGDDAGDLQEVANRQFQGDVITYLVSQPIGIQGKVLVRIEYRHPAQARCQQFLNWLQLTLRQRPELGQIIAPTPSIQRLTETITVPVPSDRIPVSVDTRPAREWL